MGLALQNLISVNSRVNFLFRFIAVNFNTRPSLKKWLRTDFGFLNFSVSIYSEDGKVRQSILFKDGKVKVTGEELDNPDVKFIAIDENAVWDMMILPPNETLNMLLKGRLRIEGNLTYATLFNFLISLVLFKKQIKMMEREKEKHRIKEKVSLSDESKNIERNRKIKHRLKGKREDGVKFLDDPFLSEYSIDDFPRLKKFLDVHFNTKPEICPERPLLLTQWYVENGFERDRDGKEWVPELRQAYAFRYLMENKKPIIHEDSLLGGSTTTKKIGVVIYPDAHGTLIWGELKTIPYRELNPYNVDEETVEILHNKVFPFWIHRNFREWVREKYNYPLSQKIDERFAAYFMWKTVALSHTIPDFPSVLKKGMRGIIEEIEEEISHTEDESKINTLKAMQIALEGVIAYSKNVSEEAKRLAKIEKDPVRKEELEEIAKITAKVPEFPAETLHEALNSIWITWVALHMENTNAGLSIGRLDQWLQPYFEADMEKLETEEERKAYVKRAIELVGDFYMRCTDHLPLVQDLGNYLFGGSSSDQVITLGGTTPDGKNAVNDMTYIFLKVTELLGIRDPNVNARYNPEVNSDQYLIRLAEVNFITSATPSLHNDLIIFKALKPFGYPEEDMRDWSATGCVEPTLSGRHFGHTNSMMMNMVAALEMALNNGYHPLMRWKVGPDSGSIEDGDFKTFDDFFEAFKKQMKFLIDQSVEYNNLLGLAHQYLRPTPLLSALIQDSIKKGKDVTKGGARYNSSGAACIGLADITDSMMAIKKLVFEKKKVSFKELKEAIDSNFQNNPSLHAMIMTEVPLFGSGSEEAVEMANRIARFVRDTYWNHFNYRGGRYTTGFWSMSNHVAFGTFTGALPSGRLAGKPFTPGLTPEPHASKSLLDNIRDVAKLDPETANNNIAFNVKVVPGASDSYEKIINTIYSYAKAYFSLGGMQMQFNIVTSEMLRDAMVNPQNYRNLLVRISGYNAYFVTLNRDMQLELIERAEYRG